MLYSVEERESTMNFITKAPVMLCGGDYNPDQWLDRPDILEADIRMMKKAGMNSVTLGVFAWAAYEPREGEYNFTWLREIMDRLYDQGIYTELATPTGAKPNWLARKYPEVLRVQSNGVRDHQGMRHNHCLTSPIYRQKVEELLNHLIDAVGDHPGLILWHISNELGGECYCPLCQERFRGWLKEKYHTIDALNHAWWTSFWSHHYDSFDEVEPPFDNGEQSLNGLKLDWRRFTTWNMMDYVHSETAILRKRTPNVPITTNLMEYFPGLDYHKLQRELDFVCWDSYPHWGRPDRSTTVTAGMTAFDHALAALTPVCGSLPKADAAMIFDWDNRWALDDAWGMQIKQKNLRETCCQLYAQLNHCGVETDVVGVDADLNRYKLVVLPMLFMTKPGFAQKIREYVENGGTVVATYLLGYVDESTLCWLGGFPGDGLREVFGVTASELDTLYPGEGNRAIWVKSSQQSSIKDYCELLQPAEGTEVVAVYGQDFYSGHAAVTHHVFGKGHAYYIGARLDDAGNAAVLRAALADAKVHLRDLPQGVEYHCRESENARYHFYINTTQSAVKVQVESGADLLSGKNVLGSMELKPYDACAIEEKVK